MNVAKNKTSSVEDPKRRAQHDAEANRLADFIMFAQRSFLLDMSKDLADGHLTYAQFFLLGYLANEDYLDLSEISEKMGHSIAAAAGLVDRLEKLGYARRIHSAEDRRQVMVQITENGIELVGRLRNSIAENIRIVSELREERGDTSLLRYLTVKVETQESDRDESGLIESINRGLPRDFWEKFHRLKEKGEDSDLDGNESEELTRMADRIEEADAERLEAVAELARLRGVPFEEVWAEFEIESAIS